MYCGSGALAGLLQLGAFYVGSRLETKNCAATNIS